MHRGVVAQEVAETRQAAPGAAQRHREGLVGLVGQTTPQAGQGRLTVVLVAGVAQATPQTVQAGTVQPVARSSTGFRLDPFFFSE